MEYLHRCFVTPPHLRNERQRTFHRFTRWTFCLFWGLTSQSTIFQSCRDGAIASWVINQYFRGVKCLAQGHNTAAVGFEPPTSRSGFRHSTTEPPRSPTRWTRCHKMMYVYNIHLHDIMAKTLDHKIYITDLHIRGMSKKFVHWRCSFLTTKRHIIYEVNLVSQWSVFSSMTLIHQIVL